MKVVVTGSLGHISKPLTEALVQKGHSVVVITHSREREKDIVALGATAAVGSVEDAAFLTKAFAGAEVVYAMVPPDFTALDPVARYCTIGNSYAAALQHAGVRGVVHLSSYGAHLPEGTGFIQGAYEVEQILNALQGVAVTHLRPGYFYYNLYHFAGMIKEAGIIGSNYGGNDMLLLVSPLDIAVAAGEEIESIATGRRIRYIVSDERRASDVARVLGAAIGKPELPWLIFSNEQVQEGMEKHGIPPSVAAKWVELGAAVHSGLLQGHYDSNKPSVWGSVKLEDFAKEFAERF